MAKRKKKRRAWTSSELRELKAMARKKTKASQIAKKLKRTEGATRQKAFSIGLSLDNTKGTGARHGGFAGPHGSGGGPDE
jgi:hypothetical protein